jgi:para-nitrobenzyl esterase
MPTDAGAPAPVVVDTHAGPVWGLRGVDGIARFGGVPYAHAARLAAPERCSWRDPLDATHPGPAAPQVVGGLDLVPGMVASRQAEDCLTAEIWSPALDGSNPVLVWVPGGSYRIGAASLPTYDGTRLAGTGTVVVGLNYRLGALGWLAADGVPSNLGLRDLLVALEWLHEVVPAFGGDPDRVVVMGESAGAGALAHVLATQPGPAPLAGAILQSGAPAATLDAARTEWVADRFFEAAGVRDAHALRALPVEALLDAQERTVQAALGPVGMMPFHPWIDGELLTAPPFCGALAPLPLVVGTTANEMELFRDQVPALPGDAAVGFLARKAAGLGITDEERVRDALRDAGGDLVEAIADLELHVPNELLARAHGRRGNRVWRYRFAWDAPVRRACHALDLPFTFGTFDVDTWREFAGAHDAGAEALSARMRATWTSFARTGTPADGTIGAWPTDALVTLGRDSALGDDAVADRTHRWLGEPAREQVDS